MKKCAKEARRDNNSLCVFTPKSLCKNWDGKMIYKTKQFCNISIKQSLLYPTCWLCLSFLHMIMFFLLIFYLLHFGNILLALEEKPIYHDLKNTGLNVSLADSNLLD